MLFLKIIFLYLRIMQMFLKLLLGEVLKKNLLHYRELEEENEHSCTPSFLAE